MDLLTSLGVNFTLVLQLGIFIAVYAVLKYVMFDPYFRAYNERNERTIGQTELAEKYVNETRELEERYATKAQEVSERFKAVYDKTRSEAAKEYDRMVSESRNQAKRLMDTSRATIQKEMETARTQLKTEVPTIAKLINNKMIGKDLST